MYGKQILKTVVLFFIYDKIEESIAGKLRAWMSIAL